MNTLVINGLNEEDFRRSIENRLREGRASVAIERLRSLLPEYARPGGILPERFLTVEPADLVLQGWDRLGDAIKRRDLPGRLISGLHIAFGWAGEEPPQPDAEGRLKPHIEVSYFSDSAFPFSKSTREDLLDGYSSYGCTWSGDAEATDTSLSLDGIDDLHGALALLEARLLASDEPDADGIRAGSLGACLLSALLVQAVADRIAQDGLPRPVCVTAGSCDVYPYFDAPVWGMPEDLVEKEEVVESVNGAPVPRYSSLLVTGIPRAKKRAILVLEENEEELAQRIALLRGHHHHESKAEAPASAPPAPDHLPEAALASPLLAKKPARRFPAQIEVAELSVPARTPAPAMAETPPSERAEPDSPAPPTFPQTRTVRPITPDQVAPGPDLQGRLQSLLAAYAMPDMQAAAPPAAEPDEPGERVRLLDRLRASISAGLRRLWPRD